MIPKIIHYVWIGTRPIPDDDARRIDKWAKILPDWEFHFWRNDNIDYTSKYLRMAYAVRAWNRVSDYVRMDALSKFGGVYLDTDVDLIRSLDPLLKYPAFLGFQAGDELPAEIVNGAVFGASKGHWLPVLLRNHFNKNLDGRDNLGSFTGPGLLTQTLRSHGLEKYSDVPVEVADVTIFPKRFFYPYSWLEQYSEDVVTKDTYAVHRWAETWVPRSQGLKTRARRRLIYEFARFFPELAFYRSRSLASAANKRTGA